MTANSINHHDNHALDNSGFSPQTQEILATLNPQQYQAVTHQGSPLLIMAGAGSGKTSVLTRRIAFLLAERGVMPWEILAITFTNKAAAEMRERVIQLVGSKAQHMWLTTFHSACVRLLRRHISLIEGMSGGFTIYDSDDSRQLITMIIKELDLNPKDFTPRGVAAVISHYKNELSTPTVAMESAQTSGDWRSIRIANIYQEYQRRLLDANACDFDDLIGLTIRVFQENPDVLTSYQEQFKHILVDEYQDTNHAQYVLVRMLVGGTSSVHSSISHSGGSDNSNTLVKPAELCVVGDSDQSIYAFRGATIRNIEQFEEDFLNATTIFLEQNYRSTQNILSAANAVITHNSGRRPKKLWTSAGNGELIHGYVADNEIDEAGFIADEIKQHVTENGLNYGSFAIFYRTNASSRAFEESLIRREVPYRIIGGVKFYERKEIKDIVAYLRVIQNPHDTLSLRRIINTPRRGIGEKALEQLTQHAQQQNIALFNVLEQVTHGYIQDIAPRTVSAVSSFVGLITGLQQYLNSNMELAEFIATVIEQTNYAAEYENSNDPQDHSRIENLNEFISIASDYSAQAEQLAQEFGELMDPGSDQDAPPGSLAAFLERVSLVADADQLPDDQQESGMVTLMTIHTAKGLEFPIVFLTGLEEGLFPHMRALGNNSELNEERRLIYVGITRAREQLYISRAVTRNSFGRQLANPPSRFLEEIPDELVDWIRQAPASDSGYFSDNSYDTSSYGFRTKASSGGFSSRSMPWERGSSAATDPSDGTWRPPKRAPKPSKKALQLEVGDRVNHQKFGMGKVRAIEGSGSLERVTIDFGHAGTVTLMTAGGLPLEKL